MDKVFYRYLRPMTFNVQRHEAETKAEGGLCFCITSYREIESKFEGNSGFLVTVSISVCSNQETFSKARARSICDVRANDHHLFSFFTEALDAETLARYFITSVDTNCCSHSPTNTAFQLFADDAKKLYADEAERILSGNRSVEIISRHSIEIIEAMGILNIYKT